jgi:hypothetical protein
MSSLCCSTGLCTSITGIIAEYFFPVFGTTIQHNLAIWNFRFKEEVPLFRGDVCQAYFFRFQRQLRETFWYFGLYGTTRTKYRATGKQGMPQGAKALLLDLDKLLKNRQCRYNKGHIISDLHEAFLYRFREIYSSGNFNQPLGRPFWETAMSILERMRMFKPVLTVLYENST